MNTLKKVLSGILWVSTIFLQLIAGLIAGYITFAEGYGNILFMWLGITFGVFLVGTLGILFRTAIKPKWFFLRLGLTAFGVMPPLLIFYFVDDFFFYSADYETPLLFPILATCAGMAGFHLVSWLLKELPPAWKITTGVGYGLSILTIACAGYAYWDWLTPFSLPTAYLEPGESLNVELVNIIGEGFSIDAVSGHYLYGVSNQRLVIMDISDPDQSTIVGQTEIIPGELLHVDLYQEYAYITYGKFGLAKDNRLHVVDVSEPTNPQYLGSIDLSGEYIWEVRIHDGFLYTIGCIECTQYEWDQHAVYIHSLAKPERPVEIGHYFSEYNINDIAIFDQYAFLALEETKVDQPGLVVVDISDPGGPREVYRYSPSQVGYSVTVNGDRLYFKGKNKKSITGLTILDVSNPLAPEELAFYPDYEYGYMNILTGGIGYETESTSPTCYDCEESAEPPHIVLTFYDFSDPEAPSQRGGLEFDGYSAQVYGHLMIAWDAVKRVYRLFDISNLDQPVEMGFLDFSFRHFFDLAGEIYLDGDKGVLPTDETMLYILDFTNPATPVLLNEYDVGDYYYVIGMRDSYIFLLSDEIQIIDISSPREPTVVWRHDPFDENGERFSMSLNGDFAFLINANQGVYAYDISDPASPKRISHQPDITGFDYIDGFNGSGDYLYILEDDNLYTFNISDPTNLTQAGTYENLPFNPWNAFFIGNLVFLDDSILAGREPATLSILDLSNPDKPIREISYHWPVYSKLRGASEDRVYMADWFDGFHLIDFSDPKDPKELAYYGIEDGATDVVVAEGDLIYVLSESNDLYILRYKPPQ